MCTLVGTGRGLNSPPGHGLAFLSKTNLERSESWEHPRDKGLTFNPSPKYLGRGLVTPRPDAAELLFA